MAFHFFIFVDGRCDVDMHATQCASRGQRTTCMSNFSFHHVGPEDQTSALAASALPTESSRWLYFCISYYQGY